jgi:hypothetical protein
MRGSTGQQCTALPELQLMLRLTLNGNQGDGGERFSVVLGSRRGWPTGDVFTSPGGGHCQLVPNSYHYPPVCTDPEVFIVQFPLSQHCTLSYM